MVNKTCFALAPGTTRVSFFGYRNFFNQTENLRNDLKDNGRFVVEEKVFEESPTNWRGIPTTGNVTISTACENDEKLSSGSANVILGDPIFIERELPPVSLGSDGNLSLINFSANSEFLEQDLRTFIRRFHPNS